MEGFLVLEDSVHASEVKAQQLYMPNGAPNFGSTQRTQGTDASVTSPDHANNNMESEYADPDQDGADHVNEDADEALDGEDEAGDAAFK
ncbi:hypothetical protein ISN44_As05g026180 [Arabidopsis suecica]|uniref:Uncharacterized protein n=1 Tax=Arabidopsis suecica TaxID=45249 RepID=A0A8T2DE86_ARASU|nr:hypothetical protein ISN44_As05g026180 [Arabidopsis suecica]